LVTNFFENTYEEYKTNPKSIKNIVSLTNDFCLYPKYNSISPFYVGYNQYITDSFTCPQTPDNYKSWKNYLNNYYGLVIEADTYIYKLYLELEKLNMLKNTNVIITSDHGEMLASHGQREKALPFNSNLNIPCLIYSPLIDKVEYNTTSDYIGSSIDLILTIMKLNNFNTTSTQFTGEPLIKLNSSNKFISKDKTDNITKGALHLQNATEANITWFGYINWFLNIATVKQKQKLNSKKIDYFNYRYAFVMNQTLYNSKQYKYGIQYSLNDLIKYNMALKNISFTNTDVINNLPNIDLNYNIIINVLIKNFDVIDVNNYDTVFDIVLDYNNLAVIFTYMYSVMKIVDTLVFKMYIIPGYNDTFSNNFKNYNLFCYDLNDDPNEVIKMLDELNYNQSNNKIFNYLNDQLNNNIKLNNLSELYVIVPYKETIYITIEIIISELKKLVTNIYKNNINPKIFNYLEIQKGVLSYNKVDEYLP